MKKSFTKSQQIIVAVTIIVAFFTKSLICTIIAFLISCYVFSKSNSNFDPDSDYDPSSK